MRRLKKITSSSLVVTIVISLILTVFCSSLIILAFYNRQIQQTGDVDSRLNYNTESAINLVLADSTVFMESHADTIDLFGTGRDSVVISKKLWGIFQVGHVKASFGKFYKSRTFLYGDILPESINACLYLADHHRPLSLAGKSRLVGDVYISRGGLRTSTVKQSDNKSNRLVDGRIKISNEFLPPFQETIIDNLNDLLKKFHDSSFVQNATQVFPGDSIAIGFDDNPLFLFTNERIRLEKCHLSGQIIVFASESIEVDNSANLENIILVAPSIYFKDGFKGKIQALARDSLIIKNECVFEYPSSLILIKSGTHMPQNILSFGENCSFSGSIIALSPKDDTYKSYIEIKNNTVVNGLVYTMGYLNLQSSVNGTVMTDYFIHRTPGSTYENYLVDVQINKRVLSDYFLFPSIFGGAVKRGIVQWLN